MITKLLLDYLKLCLGVGELSICYIFGWRVSLFPYLFSIVCMCWVCKSIHQKGIWANFTNKNRESKSRRSTYRVFRKSFIFSRLSADPSLANILLREIIKFSTQWECTVTSISLSFSKRPIGSPVLAREGCQIAKNSWKHNPSRTPCRTDRLA